MNKKPISAEALTHRLAGLCARSEQCSDDIMRKALRAGMTREAASGILARLKEKGFVDDARYASALVRDAAALRGWGTIRIRRELALRHIPAQVIADALDEIDREAYSTRMNRLALNKAASLDLRLREDSMRLYRYLASRGYTSAECVDQVKRCRRIQLDGEQEDV